MPWDANPRDPLHWAPSLRGARSNPACSQPLNCSRWEPGVSIRLHSGRYHEELMGHTFCLAFPGEPCLLSLFVPSLVMAGRPACRPSCLPDCPCDGWSLHTMPALSIVSTPH